VSLLLQTHHFVPQGSGAPGRINRGTGADQTAPKRKKKFLSAVGSSIPTSAEGKEKKLMDGCGPKRTKAIGVSRVQGSGRGRLREKGGAAAAMGNERGKTVLFHSHSPWS